MAPELARLSVPEGFDVDAKNYLEHLGICSKKVPIRGSSWTQIISDPFSFYLNVRLGLRKAINEAKALNNGSWGHAAAEYNNDYETYSKLLEEKKKNISDVGKALRYSGDRLVRLLEEETRYAACGWSWWQIVSNMPFKSTNYKVQDLYDTSKILHIFSQEDKITIPGERFGVASPIVVQPDALAVNTKTKKVWVIDWKSTSFPTSDRLSLCPLEFATQLYSHVINHLLEKKELGDHVDAFDQLGIADLTFGGMMHVAYQKPSFKFGTSEDIPYRIVSDGTRKKVWGTITFSGGEYTVKTMGVERVWKYAGPFATEDEAIAHLHELTGKKPIKETDGEPTVELYLKRCEDWYYARGKHSHLREERERSPVIDQSFVPYELLQRPHQIKEFHKRLQIVDEYSTCLATPDAFPKHSNPTGYQIKPSSSAFFPFYVTPVDQWPAIIMDKGLIQSHRD